MRATITCCVTFFALLFSPCLVHAQSPDPIWATYAGGNGFDVPFASTVDAAGNVYITGSTRSTNIALGAGVHDNTLDGTNNDAFIIKFSPSGQRLWATYFGGPGQDGAGGIVTDGTAVYICGTTSSSSNIAFGTGAYSSFGGVQDGFVAKFNAATGAGIWGSYYGGVATDDFYTMALAPDGSIVLGGSTDSDNTGTRIASSGAMKTSNSGSTDAIVVKFDANGNRLWGTYVGGNFGEWIYGLDINNSGTIFITGQTESNSGIATPGAFQETKGGVSDAFLMAINENGTGKIWGTYWGGPGVEGGYHLKVDPSGNLVIAGTSSSPGLATPGTFQPQFSGGVEDVLIGRFTADGQRLWSSYLGITSSGEYPTGLDLDEDGNILLACDMLVPAGNSGLSTNCVYQPAAAGSNEAIITKITSAGAKQWLSYYGTPSGDLPGQVSYIGNGRFALVGFTYSTAFPVTPGADQITHNGGTSDGFLTVFSDGRAPALNVTPTTLAPITQTTCVLGIPQVITGNAVSFTTDATYYTSQIFYQWQVADAPAGAWTHLEGEIFKDLRPRASQTEKYYRRLVLVNNGGCTQVAVDTSGFATVSINASIAPVANADGPQWYLCFANTVTLNGSAMGGTPGYTYEWFAGSATTPAVTTSSYSPLITTATTYTLRVTDAQGCVDIDQTTVVPVMANAGPNASLCQGRGGVQIGTTPIPNPSITYSWTLSPSGDASGTLSCTSCAQPIANPATATTYRLTVAVIEKDGSTCITDDDVTVSPVNAPNNLLAFGGTDKTVCKGANVRLGGASNDVNFSYTWAPGQYLTNVSVYNPLFNAGTSTIDCSMTYAVTATGNGCTFADEVKVTVVDASITNQDEIVCGPVWSHQRTNTFNCPEAVYAWTVQSGTGTILQTASNGASAYLYSPNGSTVFLRTVTVNGVSCSATITVTNTCGAGCEADINVLAVQGCPKVFGSATSFRLTITGIDTAAYNISWSPANMVDNSNAATVTVTSATFNTITVTATNKLIPSLTCTESIVVNDPAWSLPVFNPANEHTCPGTGVEIGQPDVVGYTYQWLPAAGLSSTTIGNPIATLNESRNYSYSVIEALSGCKTSGQLQVNIVPVIANAGNDRTVCNGATVTLGTAPVSGTSFNYSWQPSGAAYTNGTGPSDVQPQVLFASGAQTFTLTVTDPLSGCSSTDDITLRTVLQAGEYAGTPQTVCPGTNVHLGRAAEALASYEWTLADNSPATGLSCTLCANPVLTAPDVTTIYKVKVSYPGCTLPIEDLVTVTVNPAPVFDLTDKNFCPSGTVAIGFGAAGNPGTPADVAFYTWSPATGLNNTTIANPVTHVTTITRYALRVTYNNGCTRTDSVRVTPDAIIDAGPDVTVCSGQSTVIGSTAIMGATYLWTGGPFDGPADVAQPTVDPTSTTTYTLSVTSGSCTTTDDVVVTVNTPSSFAINGNAAICEGGIATVGYTGAPRANTTWQWSPTAGVTDAASANTTIAATTTTAYRLTQTNMVTGCSNYREVVIVVQPNNITATAPDIAICAGETVLLPLTVSPAGTYQYVWQPAENLSNAYVANPGITTGIARTYRVTVTDNTTSCQAVDSVRVTLKPTSVCLTPLPVTLTVFNVVRSGATALGKWETVYEENSDYFIIERSDNGRTWNAIGRVAAAGSSSSVLGYSYRDLHPLQGNNYYRLRMVDKDGGSKLSRTHWLYFGDDARIHLQLFPNPASDQVTIQFSRSLKGKATVKLISYQGQVLHAYVMNNIGLSYKLDLPTLARGVYLVLIEGEEMREHVKLMIQ